MPHLAGYPTDQIETGAVLPAQADTVPGTCTQCGRVGPVVRCRLCVLAMVEFRSPCAECLADLAFGAMRIGGAQVAVMSGGRYRPVEYRPTSPKFAELAAELSLMVEKDPHRGTDFETAFLSEADRARTREIGEALLALGGHGAMLAAHAHVARHYGFSAMSLEMAWDLIGEWRV